MIDGQECAYSSACCASGMLRCEPPGGSGVTSKWVAYCQCPKEKPEDASCCLGKLSCLYPCGEKTHITATCLDVKWQVSACE